MLADGFDLVSPYKYGAERRDSMGSPSHTLDPIRLHEVDAHRIDCYERIKPYEPA